ncbi:lasso peptide isopeptide bond-forming cyclase [Mesorhizobium denitrificans]|uniref:asparagine synthase (glutamine-hydrolyzing) n=1 Tax=Mesorhizobium denitrificans TaxID=2294114 RepID=A0A371X961_9HYPH|nr:lasso peptide isopeptide bond-forming cyclase [Mesorhizobium denitrificans]RFC65765.1 lasso peptide isopeptide bond-forming cyclase [Mesorhizobium denitrificans]
MSGIGGIYSRKGRAHNASAKVLLGAMKHRARDGGHVLRLRSASFCNAHLDALGGDVPQICEWTAPELAITADCRLDNRQELISTIGATAKPLSDAQIILHAYAKWGEECACHLEGDFAFAIWDGGRRGIYAARDRFGVKPFYYHDNDERFAFASEVRPIVQLADGQWRLTQSLIARFLTGLPDSSETTSVDGVLKLPPRSQLWADKSGVRIGSYWTVEPSREGVRTDAAEQFRDLFQRSVQRRLRGGNVGAMLSGGLDSSSICAMASQGSEGLRTYSMVFGKGSKFDEQPWIEKVLQSGKYQPTSIDVADRPPFGQLDNLVHQQEGALCAPGLGISGLLYEAAGRDGVRVLLDGHGGDEVVSHGQGRLVELSVAGRWGALWTEVRGAAKIHNESAYRQFLKLALYGMAQGPYGAYVKIGVGAYRKLLRKNGADNQRSPLEIVNESRVNPDAIERWMEETRPPQSVRDSDGALHLWQLSGPLVANGFEILDKAAARQGVEPRYPFWDKDLVTFCLALPSEWKLRDGWPRYILRKSMAGILPESVCWRYSKVDFRGNLARGLVVHHDALISDVLGPGSERIACFVNLDCARRSYRTIKNDPSGASLQDIQNVWRSVMLDRWLGELNASGVSI